MTEARTPQQIVDAVLEALDQYAKGTKHQINNKYGRATFEKSKGNWVEGYFTPVGFVSHAEYERAKGQTVAPPQFKSSAGGRKREHNWPLFVEIAIEAALKDTDSTNEALVERASEQYEARVGKEIGDDARKYITSICRVLKKLDYR